uniref:TOXIN OF TOXIN-ANTITOXIN SYSTEM n=1 Tax=Rickettsia felis TaxID=42862 RepID=UPI00023EABE6|nr:Chain A, Toxin Of Toxin-antitoxin System [Rickettsia felis]3ZVK_B Chain B, Toxin Of Toxin-antitoxin System [Rickettsia felis]3ZVK_C Chain C, Toxin Of Toxin-antitoxin System [Rickettsia felis]3ZVK_D Chain D, Toxin Of Toxin-antitoxin System [Rickettsia felis]
MIYMLGTNICVYAINKHPDSYYNNLELLAKNNTIAISSIVLAELQYGVSKSKKKEQNQSKLDIFLSRLEIIDFSAKCTFYYGELRTELEQKGLIIGNNDLLIASHAIAENATLVTNNIKEFKRIPNLILENWDK